jgi:hypothetical protein
MLPYLMMDPPDNKSDIKKKKKKNDGPEGMTIPPGTDEEPVVTTTLAWYSRTFASLTIYGELSAARLPEEFALLRMRLQKEWSFSGDLVSRFSIRFINSRLIRNLVQSL